MKINNRCCISLLNDHDLFLFNFGVCDDEKCHDFLDTLESYEPKAIEYIENQSIKMDLTDTWLISNFLASNHIRKQYTILTKQIKVCAFICYHLLLFAILCKQKQLKTFTKWSQQNLSFIPNKLFKFKTRLTKQQYTRQIDTMYSLMNKYYELKQYAIDDVIELHLETLNIDVSVELNKEKIWNYILVLCFLLTNHASIIDICLFFQLTYKTIRNYLHKAIVIVDYFYQHYFTHSGFWTESRLKEYNIDDYRILFTGDIILDQKLWVQCDGTDFKIAKASNNFLQTLTYSVKNGFNSIRFMIYC